MQTLVSLEWATDYFAYFRPKAVEWESANASERRRYLGWASVLIRSAFVFQADVDIENDHRIRVATCEQALWLMRRTDQYPDTLTKGIVSAAIGGASATFSKDFVAPLICEEAKLAIGDAGYFAKGLAIVQTMPLGGIWAERTPVLPKRPPAGDNNYIPMTDSEVEDLVNSVFDP
jgi:hypothetical protein